MYWKVPQFCRRGLQNHREITEVKLRERALRQGLQRGAPIEEWFDEFISSFYQKSMILKKVRFNFSKIVDEFICCFYQKRTTFKKYFGEKKVTVERK